MNAHPGVPGRGTGPALELTGLAVLFGDRPGLAPVSLTVQHGERLVIVGPSGAGKSSFLRTIAGLQPAGGGAIRIGGVDCARLPPERRGAVYLHQTPLLFPHLSVYENVAFPLRIRRRPASEIQQRVDAVLEPLRLGGLGNRSPVTLSGGQRHRVALARAIAARPPLLLLDEPLAALDPPLRIEAREAILEAFHDYDPGLLLVTHDLAEAGAIAHRLGVLLEGRLLQLDSPATLFTKPGALSVARFVGFSNELPGTIDVPGIIATPAARIPVETNLRGPALLLFRPEALRLDSLGPLTARVTSVRHLPAGLRISLRTGDFSLEAALPSTTGAPEIHGEVRLSVDPRLAVAFPARGGLRVVGGEE